MRYFCIGVIRFLQHYVCNPAFRRLAAAVMTGLDKTDVTYYRDLCGNDVTLKIQRKC